MLQNACVPEVMLTVSGDDPARGAVIQPEGGDVVVRHGESGIEILADPAGLRDLARWRLVLADEQAPDGTHVHLEPGTEPLATSALVAHQLPWRHRLASGWAYLIGQRGSAR